MLNDSANNRWSAYITPKTPRWLEKHFCLFFYCMLVFEKISGLQLANKDNSCSSLYVQLTMGIHLTTQ